MTITPVVWKAPFKVNTTDAAGPNGAATNEQSGPDIVALTGDRLLVAWNDSSTNFSTLEPPDSAGQILDPLGALVGGETYLSGVFGDGAQTNVDVAALPNGGFVAAYQTQDFTFFLNTGENVTFQVFDADGARVSERSNGTLPGQPEGVFQANEQRDPAVAALADGSFLIAYEDDSAGNSDIRGVLIDAAGAEQPSFVIADVADDAVAPSIARLNNGNLITVFQQNGAIRDIQFSIVTAAGAAVNSGTAAAAANDLGGPDVAALTGGGFVVVWTDDDGDGAAFDSGIKAQRFLQDGTAAGGVIAVNAPLAGSQSEASVVALADGGFFAAWSDGPSGDIRGQRFDAAGAKVGGETATPGPGTASDAELSLTGDGRILLSFTDNSGGNKDVYAAILDPRTSPVNGTAGADVLTTLVTASTVNGLGGDDVIISGAANDTLDGGLNSDIIDWSLATGAISVTLNAAGSGVLTVAGIGTDTYSNFEGMRGGSAADTLTGNAADNVIRGGLGSDILNGAGGNDTADYGDATGAATIDLRFVTQSVTGGLGADQLSSFENSIGGRFGDRLIGTAAANSLNGGGGDDTVFALAGIDTLTGGGGRDYLAGGSEDDTIDGGNGDDIWLGGDAGNDTVNGGEDSDRADGGAGNDTVNGGAGADTVTGGTGDDTVTGGAGDEIFVGGGAGNDTVSGGAGNDRVDGGADNDTVNGDGGNDYMTGGAGIDTLNGGGGNDKVYAEGGDDTLTPGLGFDQFTGGAGNDTFRFAVAEFENRTTTGFYDNIYDYSRDVPGGNFDRIQLQGQAADYAFETTTSAGWLRIIHLASVGTVYVTTAVTADPTVLAAQVEYFA